MKNIIIIALCGIILACGSKTENKETDKEKNDPKQTDRKIDKEDQKKKMDYSLRDDQIILETTEKLEWLFGKEYKKWKPEESDVYSAEKLLNECYAKEKTGTANRLFGRKLDEYDQQYIGAINSKGEKLVWINCFCKQEEHVFENWKTQTVFVADGGNCFFYLVVNLTQNNFEDLHVNGGP